MDALEHDLKTYLYLIMKIKRTVNPDTTMTRGTTIASIGNSLGVVDALATSELESK